MWKFYCFILLLFLQLLANCKSQEEPSKCVKKQKSLALFDLMEETISKAKEHIPNCNGERNETQTNVSDCSKKGQILAFLEIADNILSDIKRNYLSCSNSTFCNSSHIDGNETTGSEKEEEVKKEKFELPIDCSQVLENGHNVSGVYPIWLKNGASSSRLLEVYCDMDTDGGGWTIIQRRGDFSQQEDFYRDWSSYKSGFGNITRDFWLGNENIFLLSNQANYSIRFDLKDFIGAEGYAEYEQFKIDDESSKYTLHISGYDGNVGDAMEYHDNKMFSTMDNGNDDSNTGNQCARYCRGGWWYARCYEANLNGVYKAHAKGDQKAIMWSPWRVNDNLFSSEIKLRPN